MRLLKLLLSCNPLEYLKSNAQSCPLLQFGTQLIPRAVRKFIGVLTQLTIICRDRKAFVSFPNFSSPPVDYLMLMVKFYQFPFMSV